MNHVDQPLTDILHLPDDAPDWSTWTEPEPDHVPQEDDDPPIC